MIQRFGDNLHPDEKRDEPEDKTDADKAHHKVADNLKWADTCFDTSRDTTHSNKNSADDETQRQDSLIELAFSMAAICRCNLYLHIFFPISSSSMQEL